MRLTRAPDLGGPRLTAAAALVATLAVMLILGVRETGSMGYGLGDTDDATRMVLVRDLLAHGDWYDQLVERLQPPRGLQMHWSRLIDGGIASTILLFRAFTSPANAEFAARVVWPMLWILPAIYGAVLVVRRLAGGSAALALGLLAIAETTLYVQFRPGRIDHHGPQIALFMLALGGAATGGAAGAVIAGVATGLGLAVGLESLIFAVAVGAFFPLVWLAGRDPGGARMMRYGLALAATTAAAFLIQTPPWRWSVVACDALAFNLMLAVGVAGVALAAAARLTGPRGWRWRLGALAAAGLATAAVFVALDPHCLAGPFADVDPRLKTFWLPYVQEVRSIARFWPRSRETVYSMSAPFLMGLVAWLWLAVDRQRRTDPVFLLCGACLLIAGAAGYSAVRMATYANWVGTALIAAAVTDAVNRHAKGAMLALAAGAVAATPNFTSAAINAADRQITALAAPRPARAAVKAPAKAARASQIIGVRGDRCFQTASYQALARLPAGLVLSETDLGPFILAYTPSSALSAPYHRMNWGMITARGVMSAEAEAAQAQARELGVRYVLVCPAHRRNGDRVGMPPGSLQKRLDADLPPSWLERTDGGMGALRLYRVRP